MSTTEDWKPVVGYEEHYEVSDGGRVRTRGATRVRKSGTPYVRQIRVMSPSTGQRGYRRVTLYLPGKPPKTMQVHRVVAMAFLQGSIEDGPLVCHNDGNPNNNRVENLRWGTASSNMLDKGLHGTDPYRNRTVCPQGHPLTGDNLVKGQWERGFRNCRACHQAGSDQQYGSVLTFEQSAHMRLYTIQHGKRFPMRARKGWEARYVESGFRTSVLDELPMQIISRSVCSEGHEDQKEATHG